MIAYLKGQVMGVGQQSLTVLVNDIGYQVFVPAPLLLTKVGTEVSLFTYQHVREEALELYGFTNEGEMKTFMSLIGVSGVGPKTALNILGLTSVEQLRAAVVSGDVKILTKVSGIGKKTAERLLVELKDSFAAEAKVGESLSAIPTSDVEVIEALEQLGYGASDARQAIESIPENITGSEDRLKAALRNLAS